MRRISFLAFFGTFLAAASLWLLAGLPVVLAALSPSLRQALRAYAGSAAGWSALLARNVVGASYSALPPAVVAFQYGFSLLNLGLSLLLVRLRPGNLVAGMLALGMVGTAALFNQQSHAALVVAPGLFQPIHETLHIAAGIVYVLALLLFPDGQLPAWPWARRMPAAWLKWPLRLVYVVAFAYLGFLLGGSIHGEPAGYVAFFGLLIPVAGFTSQMLRYRQALSAAERQQAKVVLGALALAFGLSVAILATGWLLAQNVLGLRLSFRALVGLEEATFVVFPLLFAIIPVTLVAAVLRYRLWDIEVILSRGLAYGLLTGAVLLVYVVAVSLGGALFQVAAGPGNTLAAALGIGLVAVLFQPLRLYLQQGVNRLLYGQRDDPVAVLARLGKRLEAAYLPGAGLQAIVETVALALRLPYAAIELAGMDGALRVVAEQRWHGRGSAEPGLLSRFPLGAQGEVAGQLVVAARGPGETLSSADRRLLENIARQAGAYAPTARLTAELQRSREKLIAAREEERRRLRRDLHDGLGPSLASLTLSLDGVLELMESKPAVARAMLESAKAQTQSTVGDIRRLVHHLRPPALDELGLASALCEKARQLSHPTAGPIMAVETPAALPALPAAVEVAAFLIALEAMTNAARHSRARRCVVRLSVHPTERGGLNREADMLEIEISDDGRGLPPEAPPGVGLASMRDRAEEVGGSLTVRARHRGGTRVAARLPLAPGGKGERL